MLSGSARGAGEDWARHQCLLLCQNFWLGSFTKEAEAVAYIGFAGSLEPGEVDAPFAICQQKIVDSDEISHV